MNSRRASVSDATAKRNSGHSLMWKSGASAPRKVRENPTGTLVPESSYTTFSSAIAIPMPPLTHSVATPRFVLRFSISCSRVTVMRVPVHPMGCPIAIAPPFTFSRSRLKFSVRSHASTCAANASFNSISPNSCSRRLCKKGKRQRAGGGGDHRKQKRDQRIHDPVRGAAQALALRAHAIGKDLAQLEPDHGALREREEADEAYQQPQRSE